MISLEQNVQKYLTWNKMFHIIIIINMFGGIMKSKTKMILAGLALGVVGASALTGCAMTDEQQNALDKVVSKTDELVELIDKNMQYQNSQLSKQEAAEKLLIARNMFEFSKLDEFKITAILTNYVGYFDMWFPLVRQYRFGKREWNN